MSKKLIFMTGATGTMGAATVQEFLKRIDKFKLRLLVLDSPKERRKVRQFKKNKNVEVVLGNLKDSAVLERCVEGADFVLHMGAIVSPMADKRPAECMPINYGSTVHILKAIKKQPNPNEIGLVFIGTIGETGDRPSPNHWGRVGDPIKVSVFDHYSASKVAAERAVIESGLKKWVVLRQTGMLPVNPASRNDPIIFHQNLNNALEWITADESGLLMANVCEEWMPTSFWRQVYNIGGGEKWRFTAFELMEKMFLGLDVDLKRIFDPRDFALYNFHGHWFTDSDKLNDIAHFRFIDPDDYFERNSRLVRGVMRIPFLRKLLPLEMIIGRIMNALRHQERGPEWMLKPGNEAWVNAFWGSLANKQAIKSWQDGYQLLELSREPTYLDHGYDENKPTAELDLKDMRAAAKFRGGNCLSHSMAKGDLYTPLIWQCAHNHEFEATPYLILKAGHWCPECEEKAWAHAEWAQLNLFFAQVWTPIHEQENKLRVDRGY